jgi:hypothetical protein
VLTTVTELFVCYLVIFVAGFFIGRRKL